MFVVQAFGIYPFELCSMRQPLPLHYWNKFGYIQNNVTTDYAYAFVTAKAERAMRILRVDDIKRATEVPQEAGVRIATREEIQRL